METDEPQAKKDKIMQMLMPALKSPIGLKLKESRTLKMSRQRTMRGKWGIKGNGVKKDKEKVGTQTPLTGGLRVPNRVFGKVEEKEDNDPELTNEQVKQLWKEELHRRMKSKGLHCGVEWSGGLTREWNTGKRLLEQMAQSIKRDVSKDIGIKDLNLKNFLDNESNVFFKSGKYDKTRKSCLF